MQYPTILAFTFAIMVSHITCAPATNYDDRTIDNINDQTLVEVGSKFNITILIVIGKVMKNIKAVLRRQQWSFVGCILVQTGVSGLTVMLALINMDKLGLKSCTRYCGVNTTLCERYGISRLAYEYEVCEKFSTIDYTVTKNGFCLKFYAGPKTWDDAEAVCRNDGGHLVNVDSEIKAHDVNMTLEANSLSGKYANSVWIDGRRSVQGGAWSYGYKSTDSSFVYWGDDDPDNKPADLCMAYQRSPNADSNMWRWYDHYCSSKFQFVCQVAK